MNSSQISRDQILTGLMLKRKIEIKVLFYIIGPHIKEILIMNVHVEHFSFQSLNLLKTNVNIKIRILVGSNCRQANEKAFFGNALNRITYSLHI
jgi:hypothetical protein